MSKMGLVLYFGGGSLFPPHFFNLSFIVIHSPFVFKCSRLKNVGTHSPFYFIFCLNSIFSMSWTWQNPYHIRAKDVAFIKYKIQKGSKYFHRPISIEGHKIWVSLELSFNSSWLLVGSWLFCLQNFQNLSCLVSFRCMCWRPCGGLSKEHSKLVH